MSDAGQPGAATPGEHGDGTGPRPDQPRSGIPWAPATGGWSSDSTPPWHRSDPPASWANSSPRHGDLPTPSPGVPDSTSRPRLNGFRVNGHSYPEPEASAGRRGPVSAPPQEAADDRPAVTAPAVEQPPVPAEPYPVPGRRASDESAGPPRRSEPGSVSPTVRVPPHDTAAKGFEVPPGFHPSAGGWKPESAGGGGSEHPADSGSTPLPEPDWSDPSWNRPSWGTEWAPPWADGESTSSGAQAVAEPDPTGWDEAELRGRRFRGGMRDESGDQSETTGRRFRADPDVTEAGEGRRARAERPAWAVEPQRAYQAIPGHRSPEVPAAGAAEQPARPSEAAPAESGPGGWDRVPSGSVPTSAPPYTARRSAPEPAPTAQSAQADRLPDSASAMLPQRVPAKPDVPVVPEPPAVEPPAQTPELARIATHLRQADEPPSLRERPEGFDVDAILGAVRGVAGVRDAALRRTPAGAHSLRLDLADGADPAEVSRHVARLLQERMGLAAAPQNMSDEHPEPVPRARRWAAEPARDEPGPATAGWSPGGLPSRTERRGAALSEPPRRRRHPGGTHRGRAVVDGLTDAAGGATDGPATLEASYTGGQVSTTETAPSRPLDTGGRAGPRVVLDHVQVSTFGLDATVEVRLVSAGSPAAGYATGPAVDGYVLRLCAGAAAAAVDELLREPGPKPDRGRCFVEHATLVPLGTCEVATVVVLLVCDGWVEQLAGSALVAGDPRQAVVRATLAAVNRRLEALLVETGDLG